MLQAPKKLFADNGSCHVSTPSAPEHLGWFTECDEQTNTMKKTTLLFILFTCSFTLYAQPEEPDAPTPFGLLEILIGAGALYGGKKAYQNRMKIK